MNWFVLFSSRLFCLAKDANSNCPTSLLISASSWGLVSEDSWTAWPLVDQSTVSALRWW